MIKELRFFKNIKSALEGEMSNLIFPLIQTMLRIQYFTFLLFHYVTQYIDELPYKIPWFFFGEIWVCDSNLQKLG